MTNICLSDLIWFKRLSKNILKFTEKNRAGFYWDFDSFYMPPNKNEAGHYIENTLKTFLMSLNRLTKVSIITCLQAKELHMLTHPQKTFRQDT